MKNDASSRILDKIEDYGTVETFLFEMCMFIRGNSGAPIVRETNDSTLCDYMSQIAEVVIRAVSDKEC